MCILQLYDLTRFEGMINSYFELVELRCSIPTSLLQNICKTAWQSSINLMRREGRYLKRELMDANPDDALALNNESLHELIQTRNALAAIDTESQAVLDVPYCDYFIAPAESYNTKMIEDEASYEESREEAPWSNVESTLRPNELLRLEQTRGVKLGDLADVETFNVGNLSLVVNGNSSRRGNGFVEGCMDELVDSLSFEHLEEKM